jgi:hypothetical protein
MTASAPTRRTNPAKLLLLLCTAAFFAWALFNHQFRLNDQHYMLWSWQHLPSGSIYPTAAACSAPFFLAQWLYARRPASRWIALVLVSASTFAMMIALRIASSAHHDLSAIAWAVINPANGGYFAEGIRYHDSGWSASQILRLFPQVLPNAIGHAYNKPPGLPLFCFWLINYFGPDSTTQTLFGLFTAFIAALSIPACYILIKHLTANCDAAFCGASFLALCPSLILIFPTPDQLFPPLAVLLILLWSASLKTDRPIFSALFGLALALTFFLTYLPAVLIFFVAGLTFLKMRPDSSPKLPRIASHAGAAAICFAAFYLALWLTTRFNPIASFLSAWRNEHLRIQQWCQSTGFPPRNLPGTIPWDLYSFAIGTAYIGCLLAIFYFSPRPRGKRPPQELKLNLLCIAQILFVALTGILPGETVRLWMFMLPLLMLPIGLELSRWGTAGRLVVYVALLALTAVLCQSMIFIV